jgi:undecaprenyl-diphosphatase
MVVGRFIPIIRTFVPFVAGVGEMSYLKFITYNMLGGFLWVSLSLGGGYCFGDLPFIKQHFSYVLVTILIISIIPGIIDIIRKREMEGITKMMPSIQNLDNSVLLYIKDNMHGHIMDRAMVIITTLGNGGIIWIMIAILLMSNKKYRNIGFMALVALILSTVLGEGILKHVIQRIRPSADIPAVNLLISKPLSYSFPSGHTTSSFAVAGVLAKYFKDYALEFFSLASVIAFSRLYLYVHYPTDVLAGIVLGLICSKVTIYIFDRFKRSKLFSMQVKKR